MLVKNCVMDLSSVGLRKEGESLMWVVSPCLFECLCGRV